MGAEPGTPGRRSSAIKKGLRVFAAAVVVVGVIGGGYWALACPCGGVPGFVVKLVALALIWAYLHHLIAGLRHVYMDVNHAVGKAFGRASALATLVLSLILTLGLGLKLFGLY